MLLSEPSRRILSEFFEVFGDLSGDFAAPEEPEASSVPVAVVLCVGLTFENWIALAAAKTLAEAGIGFEKAFGVVVAVAAVASDMADFWTGGDSFVAGDMCVLGPIL